MTKVQCDRHTLDSLGDGRVLPHRPIALDVNGPPAPRANTNILESPKVLEAVAAQSSARLAIHPSDLPRAFDQHLRDRELWKNQELHIHKSKSRHS